jgi:glucosamine-6-phosphate deaminase
MRVSVLETADEIGGRLAERVLSEVQRATDGGRRYLLGCPTGRTPRPIYAAMARKLSDKPQDLSGLTLVMMDEYLLEQGSRFVYAADTNPWSCHFFARQEIRSRLNGNLPEKFSLQDEAVWFPDPADAEDYDARIADAGGIDFFILASGATDGHVGFNPPGSPRDSRTRIVALSEQTRRDNLQTFPAFGTIDAVPTHGVSVGISTISQARNAVLVLIGRSKRESLSRVMKAEHYDPDWPATVIHEFTNGEIIVDREAAANMG